MTKIKLFINEYDWEGINSLSKKDDDWKKFKKNNVTIALNVCMLKKKKISCFLCFKTIQIIKNKLFFE